MVELNKLNRELNKQIDNSTNVRSQQKLRDFQKELLDLQASGVKMSEYDLQNLQKRYDLKLAELALEESQNAKSQVRLVKDSKGNYSYVYNISHELSPLFDLQIISLYFIYVNIFYGIRERNISLIFLEIFVVFIEGFVYSKTLKYKKINWFLLSLILNVASFLIGEVINYFV